jgi:hypothetical protein
MDIKNGHYKCTFKKYIENGRKKWTLIMDIEYGE